MSDLLTYASAYRRSTEIGGTPHIMTRGKQFEIQGSDAAGGGMQFCVRQQPPQRTGKPPRRAGGGKYARIRAAAFPGRGGRSGCESGMEHTQVAFTNPNWRDYGAGAPAIKPVPRGVITNIGTDHEVRAAPSYDAPVTSATFHARGGANTVASPAFETAASAWRQLPDEEASFVPGSSSSSSSRYARPFHAEAFSSASVVSVGSSSVVPPPPPTKKGGYATLAVGAAPPTADSYSSFPPPPSPPSQPVPQIGMNASAGGHAGIATITGPPTSVGREPFLGGGGGGHQHQQQQQEGEGGEGEEDERHLPMYWYSAAPSESSSSFLNTYSPWNRDANGIPHWAGHHSNDAADDDQEYEGFGGDDALRLLTARVDRLSKMLEQRRGGDNNISVNEEWLASAILGLFVICVVDTLRR